jgi:hypothetical protein
MNWKERSYRVRSLARPGVYFSGDGPDRVKLALALLDRGNGLGIECIGDAASDEEGAEIVLRLAARCDLMCAGDDHQASNGYLLMRDAGVSDRVMFAIDCLRRARRVKH